VDCHKGDYAAHGFNGLPETGSSQLASGHNTTTYGTIGAKTMFDGSQGVTLHSFNTSSAEFEGLLPGEEEVLTTEWQFPTVNVFWGSTDASAPASAMKSLTSTSVVTCQDCHAGLDLAGPHGAAEHFGIDPAYPADYSYAELSKWIVTNPSGIKVRSTVATFTISATTGLIAAAGNPALIGTAPYTSGQGVICSKCHDLQNLNSGTTFGTAALPWWDAGSASTTTTVTGRINTAAVGSANTAHASHHQDQVDGSAQCVNCHIGVPHGWKRPRLLVQTGTTATGVNKFAGVVVDSAPYLDPDHLGTSRAQNGVTLVNGWNKIGWVSTSGTDDHMLSAGGAALWTEWKCDACNDHTGSETAGGVTEIDSLRIKE